MDKRTRNVVIPGIIGVVLIVLVILGLVALGISKCQ